jgi:hypothetical protein
MAIAIAFFFLLWSCVAMQCSEEGNGSHTAFFFYFGYVAGQEGDGNNVVVAFFFFFL